MVGLVAAVVSLPLSAQFYSNGASPGHYRWQKLEGENIDVIAPDFADAEARRVIFIMDSLSGSIGYGLLPEGGLRPLRMPVVMHAASSASNGISIMAPARIEMCVMPSTESYATPWLRQLSVHEYRHAAQYSALFGNTARWLYYLLGEQALLATTGVMPFWWLEGDAVDAETQASLFGRALQPSFTMHYRAVGRELLESPNKDVWFSGSYNHFTPSHYNLGYQMVTTANTLKGGYAWGEVMDYARRHPYTITPFEWGMRHHLGYSTEELFEFTFARLNDHWESLPEREDNAERIALSNPRHESPYETYRYPQWADNGTIVALKSTFDTPAELVEVDLEWGYERRLYPTGHINTPPAIVGDLLYWTEISQLSSFSQEMGSLLYCAPKNGNGSARRVRQAGDYVLYPTDFEGSPAWVRYNLDGTYTVVYDGGTVDLPREVECHGLAADGGCLYLLLTSPEGMSIQSLRPEEGTLHTVKPSTRATLSCLRAQDGHLYFGSTLSGYDEVHTIDLRTLEEHQLTTSHYGSFEGTPSPDGTLLALTSYDATGYHLATAPMEEGVIIEASDTPRNIVNPARYRWENFPCIDTLRYGPEEAKQTGQRVRMSRFAKGANALNIHSWAPIYYRPEQLASGNLSDIRLGLTATSANLLSDAITTLGLYYLPKGAVGANLNLKYIGLVPKFELNANVSSASPSFSKPVGVMMHRGDYHASYDHSESAPTPPLAGGYYSLYARGYLPVILKHSYWTSVLTPSVELSHANNHLYSPTTKSYSRGQTLVAATLQWNSYTASAYRNLQPRWGVALIGGVGKSLAPFQTTTTVGLFARAYTPAFGANDGLTWKASYQDILGSGPLNYSIDFGWLIPRGLRTQIYPDDQIGLGVQYDTPLLYPDWGVEGIVLLKRVRGSLFAESLMGRLWTNSPKAIWDGTVCVGGDVWLDTSWLRLPDQGDISFRLGCYFDTRELSKPTFSAGFSVNF